MPKEEPGLMRREEQYISSSRMIQEKVEWFICSRAPNYEVRHGPSGEGVAF